MHIPDDISEIDVDDPLEALIKIDRTIRPTPGEGSIYPGYSEIWRYYETISHAAQLLGIDFDVVPRTNVTEGEKFRGLFDDMVTAIDKKKIELAVTKAADRRGVALDGAWRAKVHAYCAHIRSAVEKAKLDDDLRQSILNRLNDLEREVDRERTRMQVFGAVIVELCTAVGTGAKELEPAIRAIERVTAAVGQLERNPPLLLLPSPDKYGLEDDKK